MDATEMLDRHQLIDDVPSLPATIRTDIQRTIGQGLALTYDATRLRAVFQRVTRLARCQGIAIETLIVALKRIYVTLGPTGSRDTPTELRRLVTACIEAYYG